MRKPNYSYLHHGSPDEVIYELDTGEVNLAGLSMALTNAFVRIKQLEKQLQPQAPKPEPAPAPAKSVEQVYAMAQVCLDLHAALGVRWGDDPYAEIWRLQSKPEPTTTPATTPTYGWQPAETAPEGELLLWWLVPASADCWYKPRVEILKKHCWASTQKGVCWQPIPAPPVTPAHKPLIRFPLTAPKPETEAPEEGTEYYVPTLGATGVGCYLETYDWEGDALDKAYLKDGLVYLRREDAEARLKAMLEWTPAEEVK